MKFFLILFLIGCVKYPCRTVVDVEFSGLDTITATTMKYVKCGDIPLPYQPTKNKTASIRFIEVNFFQSSRVVRADVVFGSEFKDSTFSREYEFFDTDPNLMVWKVFTFNGTSEHQTIIK